MIRHLKRSVIDGRWWDERLLACPNRTWYARSWVLDIASPDWEALVDEENGALFPLTWRRKYGVRYLFQPFGLQQLGVFAPAPLGAGSFQRLLQAVPAAVRYADISITFDPPYTKVEGWISEPRTNMIIPSRPVGADHRLNYSKGHLRTLKKEIMASVVSIDVPAFMSLFLATTLVQHGPFDKAGLRSLPRLIQGSLDRGEGAIDGLLVKGELVAAVWWVQWQGRVILMKSANTVRGRGTNAMFHLVDRRLGGLLPSEVLDLAGSDDPGTRRFYEGFGARPSTYFRLRRNTLPRWIRNIKP